MVLAEMSVEGQVLGAVLQFWWLVYAWKAYLAGRQRKIYEATRRVPAELGNIVHPETFEKYRLYLLDRSTFDFWSDLYNEAVDTLILVLGGIPFLWNVSEQLLDRAGFGSEYEKVHSLAFLFLAMLFVLIEEKHGYKKLVLSFGLAVLSRRFVFQADAFVRNLGKAEDLFSALIKLSKDNLDFPVLDWMFSMWHYSHPPLLERLQSLKVHKQN